MSNEHKTIISLCDYTGIWSQPYREAGYNILQVDLKHGQDVRLFKFPGRVHGVICQPPCTHLAGSGARRWKSKGEAVLLEALSIADACARIVLSTRPEWWVMENPVGRLKDYFGPPAMTFNPADYALLADCPDIEAYTKRTCLWGNFTPPLPIFTGQLADIAPRLGSKMHLLPPSPQRATLRSVTPVGFSMAFFIANP